MFYKTKFSYLLFVFAFICSWYGVSSLHSPVANAQSAKTLGKDWPAKFQVNVRQIDHVAWNNLLKKYVNKDGRVNYKAWKESRADRQMLRNYLEYLCRKKPESFTTVGGATKKAELAYWINAYNALTIDGMLGVYPTTSIRNHTAKVWGYNIWTQHKMKVGGKDYSLDDIEHKILRKMKEPRIHFAIVCASIGCPRLLNQAYTAKDLDTQLDTNAKDFFSRKQNYRIDKSNNRVYLSSILKWFASDFGSSQSEQLKRIAPYVPQQDQDRLKSGRLSVNYLNYDWNINRQ